MAELITGFTVFSFLIGTLGLPVVATSSLRADERLCLGAVVGCIVLYIAAWLVYWIGLSSSAFYALPIIGLITSIIRHKALVVIWRDEDARSLVVLWMIVAGWCLGLLTLVRSYSGGEWAGDWLEHYHRSQFFLERLPLDTLFLNMYLVPARPPLVNLVLGPCLTLTNTSFACYQVFVCLYSSLAFIPAALLARRFRNTTKIDPAGALAILLMLCPAFVQNATFAWTKLPATFFVLSGLYFFISSHRLSTAATVCLAAALLTHYSAAPYLIALAAIAISRRSLSGFKIAHWKAALLPVSLGTGLLATWFAWSIWYFGLATFSSNTVVANPVSLNWRGQIVLRFENLYNLVVPHPLRSADYIYIEQNSAAGWWRDYFFNIYQTNLLFAFGSIGFLVLSVLLWRKRRQAGSFWGWFVGIVIFLHAAVISWSDRWGSVHIDLLPMVMLGLSCLAAGQHALSRRIKIFLAAGLLADCALGIILHFALQHVDLSTVFANFRDKANIEHFGFAAWSNYFSKAALGLRFVGDNPPHSAAVILALVSLLSLALVHVNRTAGCIAGKTDRAPR